MLGRYRRAWYEYRSDRPSPHICRWIDAAGHSRRRSYRSRKLALAAVDYVTQRLNAPLHPGLDAKSWEDLICEYDVTLAGESASYRVETFRVLAYFTRIIGPRSLSDCTAAAIDRYLAARAAGEPKRRRKHARKGNPGPATLHKEYRVLRTFFRTWVARQYLDSDPTASVRAPHVPQPLRHVPTTADWIALLESIERPGLGLDDMQAWHLLILLAATTGARQRDLLALRPADVTLGAAEDGCGLLCLTQRKTRRQKLIGLPPEIASRVAARIADLPDGAAHLFPWRTWDPCRRRFERLCGAAHFRFTFHSLRASAGTQRAEAAALAAGADALDHSSPRVFARHYADAARIALATARRAATPPLPRLPRPAPSPPAEATPPAHPPSTGSAGPA